MGAVKASAVIGLFLKEFYMFYIKIVVLILLIL